MASATATATMAAAGFDKRPSTASSLQTPASGTFPSELLSPMTASPGFMKREDALRTPITPPSAYLDFLKNYTPAIQSPASTGTSARFSFNDKSFDMASDKLADLSGPKSALTPPTSQPSLSRNTSYDSNASTNTDKTGASNRSAANTSHSKPESPRVIIPPSPFARPAPRSARTPRRLHIPQSPFSPALGSAHSVPSPYSSTPLSAAPWSASFSPRDYSAADATSQPGKVHVRQVVTRTVTYCRTPLEPAPKGKRRKIEHDDTASSSKASSEEPSFASSSSFSSAIKQERFDKIEEVSESSASEKEA